MIQGLVLVGERERAENVNGPLSSLEYLPFYKTKG